MAGHDCPVGHLEALESGKIKASRSLFHIAVVTHVRADWLMFGEGTMIKGGVESEISALVGDFERETEEMLDLWGKIPTSMRPHYLAFMRQMAKSMEPGYRALEADLEETNRKRDA